jgi:hypothetical protein
MNDTQTARGLGWASIGIGLTEIAVPKQLEKMMGIGNGQNTGILRMMGVREIMQGVDILTHRDPGPGIFARVAGDVLDSVLMGAAATKTKRPMGLAMTFALVLPIVVMDALEATRLARKERSMTARVRRLVSRE